jgi:hypothetical protein
VILVVKLVVLLAALLRKEGGMIRVKVEEEEV